MALSAALAYAKHNPSKKILVFTTDPAPSIGDSLDQKIGAEPTLVVGTKNLWALEIDAASELKKFKKKYGDDILDILQEGTYLADEETEEMFSLEIPGIDEVMGLKKIIDFIESKDFDLYVLDTAPTGHTLRLLTMPELLDKWIKFLARLRWKYHYMVNRFSRGGESRIEKADEFLLEMKKVVNRVKTLLSNASKTSFIIVTIAEAMGVEESKDLAKELKHHNIKVGALIINNIVPIDDSPFLIARRKLEETYIDELKASFKEIPVIEVELKAEEVRGIKSLLQLGNMLLS
jgi:arsenite/tail-anchored protein-transporting ATPase